MEEKHNEMDDIHVDYENFAYNEEMNIIIPVRALKKKLYKCPACDKDVILRKGSKNIPYFAHKNTTNCEFYSNNYYNNNNSISNSLAKMFLIKTLSNYNCSINRYCNKCSSEDTIQLLNIDNNYTIRDNYKYIYNNKEQISDIVLLKDGKIKYIFEISKFINNSLLNRPEPWFIINKSVIESKCKIMPCGRQYICDNCKRTIMNITNCSIDYYELFSFIFYNKLTYNKDVSNILERLLETTFEIIENDNKDDIEYINPSSSQKINLENISELFMIDFAQILNHLYKVNISNIDNRNYLCISFNKYSKKLEKYFYMEDIYREITYYLWVSVCGETTDIILEDSYGKNMIENTYYDYDNNKIYYKIKYAEKETFKSSYNGKWDSKKKRWFIYDCYANKDNIEEATNIYSRY